MLIAFLTVAMIYVISSYYVLVGMGTIKLRSFALVPILGAHVHVVKVWSTS